MLPATSKSTASTSDNASKLTRLLLRRLLPMPCLQTDLNRPEGKGAQGQQYRGWGKETSDESAVRGRTRKVAVSCNLTSEAQIDPESVK